MPNFNIESENTKDPIEGFGVQRYDEGFHGAVGDSFPVHYEKCNVICKANSIDGKFLFNSPLNKYVSLEIDIENSSLRNDGLPHIVVEDTMEWVNSGLPSSLSQVVQSNVVNLGIHTEKKYPSQQESYVGPYQARYVSPTENDWYDKDNSTIDYSLVINEGNRNLYLVYPTCVLHVTARNEVWVGGPGGILVISISTKDIRSLILDEERVTNIKDMKVNGDYVYILEEHGLYIYDLNSNEITRDEGLGLPSNLYCFTVMPSSNLVIGGNDGIYARKNTQTSWQKVADAGICDILANPDACFIVSDRQSIWYSTEGFFWKNIGKVASGIEINKIAKHRSQLYIGTNKGLYSDSGSFYSGSVAIAFVDVFGVIELSNQIIVNDVVSNFNKLIIGINDGRHLVFVDDFIEYDTSILGTIHRVLIVDDDVWVFGYDCYKVMSEEIEIRKLATGDILR